MCMEVLSFVVGVMSVVLGIIAIFISKRESKRSKENYESSMEVLMQMRETIGSLDKTLEDL